MKSSAASVEGAQPRELPVALGDHHHRRLGRRRLEWAVAAAQRGEQARLPTWPREVAQDQQLGPVVGQPDRERLDGGGGGDRVAVGGELARERAHEILVFVGDQQGVGHGGVPPGRSVALLGAGPVAARSAPPGGASL